MCRRFLARPGRPGASPTGRGSPTSSCAATSSSTSIDPTILRGPFPCGGQPSPPGENSWRGPATGSAWSRLRTCSRARRPSGRIPPNRAANPYAVRAPHHAARAKRCIFLYMPGGPSHVDLFDPKPRLAATTASRCRSRSRSSNAQDRQPAGLAVEIPKHGQSGIEVSELLPRLASCIDDICVIRSMVADNINHTGAALQMCTGEQAFSRPSMGSWLVYGLGTENQNLPGFVVVSPAAVFQGAQLWASSFLPSAYQGTLVRDLKNPIANLTDPSGDPTRQRDKLDALRRLNEIHKRDRVIDSAARRPNRLLRAGLPHATRSPGGVRPLTRERRDAAALWHRQSGHRHVRPAMPDGPAAGRARRALRAALRRAGEQRLGPSQRSARELASTLRRRRSADRRLAPDRPEGARPARRHAGPLGRRIRPHADGRGHRRPRASSLRLHDVAGRRRRQGRHDLRRHRRIRLARRDRTRSTSTTCTPPSCT